MPGHGHLRRKRAERMAAILRARRTRRRFCFLVGAVCGAVAGVVVLVVALFTV